MAGIASQFIDLSDGEYHLIPANAINLVLYVDALDQGWIVEHSPDKVLNDELREKDDNPGPLSLPPMKKAYVEGLNPIEEPICQYIRATAGMGAKLYFGVS